MSISEKEFKHVAQLAKLSFSEEQVGPMNQRFTEILDMVDQLSEVETEDVPVMTHGIKLQNVMREDIPSQGIDRDLIMKNVSSHQEGMIVVPDSFDESGD